MQCQDTSLRTQGCNDTGGTSTDVTLQVGSNDALVQTGIRNTTGWNEEHVEDNAAWVSQDKLP